MGFHHVGQAGLKLLTSGDQPASASQRAGITGLSHHARPYLPLDCTTSGSREARHIHSFSRSSRRQGYKARLVSNSGLAQFNEPDVGMQICAECQVPSPLSPLEMMSPSWHPLQGEAPALCHNRFHPPGVIPFAGWSPTPRLLPARDNQPKNSRGPRGHLAARRISKNPLKRPDKYTGPRLGSKPPCRHQPQEFEA
ncbi:hypothetical protein AAY473_026739 [Plecturocebus cupreus]